ncbi:MAG: hydroxyquinol 1,2-dioxygenase [Rhodospirillaceae bacterium]|jgi:hydroxyquinol 1,2-dioxygenase|nr:hydroxyquinol 1,2-dioxygenase [Rhodospirillaceae bacterium]MBT5459024.1 hydroxyquinol 1,2-dioxygenase [Rhodospirillaceae bacterium]
MPHVTKDNLTDAVIATLSDDADPRFREIMTALIRHMHGFVREVDLSQEEWLAAIEFLYQTGQKTTRKRNEFILLSDTLGVTSLIDLLSGPATEGTTESSVLGPFYVEGAPMIGNGGDLIGQNDGIKGVVRGRVSSADGKAIPGALLDVWQNADNGQYSVEDPDQDDFNLRCRMHADDAGHYNFTTIRPKPYTVPDDGPAGAMLHAMGRHPWRPAHIHFKVSAEGHQDLITELYPDDDEYIDEDAVFGVRDSLSVSFVTNESEEDAKKYGLNAPFFDLVYDFVLRSA